MSDSIWTATLANFRDRVAGIEPVPAGVTAAAVSATLGFGLLTKVLEIASKRKDFAGDRAPGRAPCSLTRAANPRLCRNSPTKISRRSINTWTACGKRSPWMRAMRRAIEVPLNVARIAASGVEICEKAASLVHAFVAPDVKTAAALLTAAVRSTLQTVEFNLQQLAEDASLPG